MIARLKPSRYSGHAFAVLFREFFGQFFASESATSDHQVRVAIIGIVVFLVTPGIFVPVQLFATFNLIAVRFPDLLDPMIRLLSTLFITYSIVTTGVVAALAWDCLSFDRRDAMVLGPLPIRGATIVAAKLAAMAALLMTVASIVSLVTAVPFAFVASGTRGIAAVGRHLVAHLTAATCAAAFVFCILVIARASLGMIAGQRVAIASLVQFALVTALLCFIVFAPTALGARPGRRGAITNVHLLAIPGWLPINWYLALHEWIRGQSGPEIAAGAARAIEFTALALAGAVFMTMAAFRRHVQLALTPSASTRSLGATRVQRALARAICGRDQVARASADFVLTTLARNRAPQIPLAITTAIGMAMAIIALARSRSDVWTTLHSTNLAIWIPLLFVYWIVVGLRASFFVPAELPASWCFRLNAPRSIRAYWTATRAAMLALVGPPAVLAVAGPAVILFGWRAALWHTAIVLTVLVLLVEIVASTIDFMPFTAPYRPGHAKLKTRWPLYLIGQFLLVSLPARLARQALDQQSLLLLAAIGTVALGFHLAGWWRAKDWTVRQAEDVSDDPWQVTVLDLGQIARASLG